MDSMDNTPLDGAPAPGGEEPGTFLDQLLARADNMAGERGQHAGRRDDASDGHDAVHQDAPGPDAALLARLRTALMHCTELHAMRHRKGPPRAVGHRTLKHVFLLADGSDAALWEVEHNGGADDRTGHQLYADRIAAEEYVRRRFGEPPPLDLWPRFGVASNPAFDSWFGTEGGAGTDPVFGIGFDPRSDPEFVAGRAAALDPEGDSGSELGRLIAEVFFTARRAEQLRGRRARHAHHDYQADNSADHAWRVIRRAENTDRPGEPVRRLLRSAVGHRTTLITLRHDTVSGSAMEWSLYEHAFLLADGAEISLWELEHTITSDGRPVCEVYLDEATARDSVDRHRAG